MDEKDKIIASLRKQLKELNEKCSAQQQEIALLNEEIRRSKRVGKRS